MIKNIVIGALASLSIFLGLMIAGTPDYSNNKRFMIMKINNVCTLEQGCKLTATPIHWGEE